MRYYRLSSSTVHNVINVAVTFRSRRRHSVKAQYDNMVEHVLKTNIAKETGDA
jgi:hypothetical protein